jgi:hypothetical protein
MSTPTIPEHFPDTWDDSWVSALQTAEARMVPGATPDTATGDRKWYNIGGTVTYSVRPPAILKLPTSITLRLKAG